MTMKYKLIESNGPAPASDGEFFEAKTLTSAKRTASKRQAFYGTELYLYAPNGECLSYKDTNGSWHDSVELSSRKLR